MDITLDTFSQFQLQKSILKNFIMFTTYLILGAHIQLWPIKPYAAFFKKKLMIIVFAFLKYRKFRLEALLLKPIYQILILQKTILLTTIPTQIYWEWASYGNSVDTNICNALGGTWSICVRPCCECVENGSKVNKNICLKTVGSQKYSIPLKLRSCDGYFDLFVFNIVSLLLRIGQLSELLRP